MIVGPSCLVYFALHAGNLTWNLKVDLWKTISLYNPVVFRFHVGLFPGVFYSLLYEVLQVQSDRVK